MIPASTVTLIHNLGNITNCSDPEMSYICNHVFNTAIYMYGLVEACCPSLNLMVLMEISDLKCIFVTVSNIISVFSNKFTFMDVGAHNRSFK